MKFLTFPPFLLLAVTFGLFVQESQGQRFAPRSIRKGPEGMSGYRKLKKGKKSKDTTKTPKTKKPKDKPPFEELIEADPSNFFQADEDFGGFDLDLSLGETPPLPEEFVPDLLSCKETLEGAWVYDCGGCDCNKFLVTISCKGDNETCTYVEQEYPGDCGLDPVISESWENPCTLNGEFPEVEILKDVDGMCRMAFLAPVNLDAGETCSDAVTQNNYALKAEYSPASKGATSSSFKTDRLYLYVSQGGGENFEEIRFATKLSDDTRRGLLEGKNINDAADAIKHRQLCDVCAQSNVQCPAQYAILFTPEEVFPPSEGPTPQPTPSPTDAPTEGSALCKSNVKAIVGFAVDSITEGVKVNLAVPGATILGISVGLGKLIYDLACETGGYTVPQLLANDVRTIAFEAAKEVNNDLLTIELVTLSRDIRIYARTGKIPMNKLKEFAQTANTIESQLAGLGIIGFYPMLTAAAIKLNLLTLLSHHIESKQPELTDCCQLATFMYEDYLNQTKENLEMIRNDFNAYKRTRDDNSKIHVQKSRAGRNDNTCPSNCMDCGLWWYCCYPWSGYWKARDESPAVTSKNICVTQRDHEDKMKRAIQSLVDQFFLRLERTIFTQAFIDMEKLVGSGATSMTCATSS